MAKTIKILGQADRVDLIRHITKQRASAGKLYTPPFLSVSLESLDRLARDFFELAGHPTEHAVVQNSKDTDSYSVAIQNDSLATISLNKKITEQTPYLALHMTTIACFAILLRRYGPHRYSNEQEIIICAHASVLLGFGIIGLNAYHEHLPKNTETKPMNVISRDKYTEWLEDYLDRHQLRRTIAPHLLPTARKALQLNSQGDDPTDPLLSSYISIHKTKRQKQFTVIAVSSLALVGLFVFWSHIPRPLNENQLLRLQQIEQAKHAYEVCRDELTTMTNVMQRDIMASRSLQAKYRSCESLRQGHNQMVKEFQGD